MITWTRIILVLYISLYLPDVAKSEPSEKFRAPTFGRRIFTNFSAVAGEKEVKLVCHVLGPSETHYWWLKNGENIDTTKKRFGYKRFRYFKIKNVKRSDAGEYTCMASNRAGHIEHKMYFYVTDQLVSSPIVLKINNVTAYDGDNVIVTCEAYSAGFPHFQWLIFDKIHKNMTMLRRKLHELDYIYPSERSKLYGVKLFMPNVTSEDAMEYICLAGNYVGYSYQSFFLHVLPGRTTIEPSDKKNAPKFGRRVSANSSAFEGDKEVKLVCHVLASSETQYWWLKNGKRIDTTKKRFHYKRLRYLKIKNLRKSDAGEYTCVASNSAGQIEQKMQFYVLALVVSKPIMPTLNNLTVYEGDNVTVICKAYSDGFPHFQWLIFDKVHKNLTVLRPNMKQTEYVVSTDGLYGVKLFLTNVSFEDAMEYTCLAGNDVGYDHQSFFLHVLPRIHTSARRPTVTQQIADNSESGVSPALIIIPVVSVCVLVLIVVLIWLVAMQRKRRQERMNLRHKMNNVTGNGDLLVSSDNKETQIKENVL